jgi:O-antigen/teichoic acid export membrane protein
MPKFSHAISQTILYGFSIVIMKGISILMLPFIAHQLSQEAFGKLEVLSSFAIVVSILVGLGLEDTLYRFAGQATSAAERKRIAAKIFGLGAIAGAIALAIVWFSADSLSRLLPGDISVYEVRLIMLVLALEGLIAVPMGWLRMQDRVLSFFSLSISRAAIHATLILVMLQPGDDITAVLEAGLVAATIQAIVLAFLQIRDTGISIRLTRDGSLIRYSLPIVGSGLIAFILNGLDRWVIADQAGLAQVAEYGVASKFALAAVLLLQPFGMWWSPKRFQIAAQPGGKQTAERIIGIGISLCLITCVAVSTGAPVLIDLLMPSEYVLASSYALGLVLAMTLREISELINIGCYINRSTLVQFWINLSSSVIGLIIMLTAVGELGVWGVIVALISAQLIRLLLFFLASQSVYRLNYPLPSIGLLAAQALVWLGFSTQLDGLVYQFSYAFLASTAMLVSAVALKLIPLPSRGNSLTAKPGLAEW